MFVSSDATYARSATVGLAATAAVDSEEWHVGVSAVAGTGGIVATGARTNDDDIATVMLKR